MRHLIIKRILVILSLPLFLIISTCLIWCGYILFCQLGISEFLPVGREILFEQDGLTIVKVEGGATSPDNLFVYKNDSLLYKEPLYFEGYCTESVLGVEITDSIRIAVLGNGVGLSFNPKDTSDTIQRTICLPL